MSNATNAFLSPTRSAVLTTGGLVCSASPLAGAIGAQVLRGGGNAFDAAVAVAASEAVTLSPMCGVGGEVFALFYEASTGKVYDITGSGAAPAGATRDFFVSKGYTKMPQEGPLTPSVPGEVDAWQTIVTRFGTRSLAELIEPAIGLAERGYPIPGHIGAYYAMYADKIGRYPSTAAVFAKGGHTLVPGDVIVQPALAKTLRRIADGGADEFYRGALAREIASAVQAAGGLMTADDLARQQTHVVEATASTDYRGYTVYANAPPSQGYMLLETLNIAEGFDLPAMGQDSAEAAHVLAEALKLAFADRLAYLGDPAFVDVPLAALLSKKFAEARRESINPGEASKSADAGAPAQLTTGVSPSTSYFCVVDADGNAVSFIHSISQYFGSGLVAGETGVLLNDRVGRGFYLEEGHPNVVEPGKRTMNTIQTYMALRDGKPVLVGGTPGGDRQPSWNVQVLSNVLDHGLNVQEAADLPRWQHFPGSDPATSDLPFELRIEDGFNPDSIATLERLGHTVAAAPSDQTTGSVQLIAIDQGTGVRSGGTDRRSDGYPIPS
jgi:gamma-glutamyltranspeptidase/glutathione hydrolase